MPTREKKSLLPTRVLGPPVGVHQRFFTHGHTACSMPNAHSLCFPLVQPLCTKSLSSMFVFFYTPLPTFPD